MDARKLAEQEIWNALDKWTSEKYRKFMPCLNFPGGVARLHEVMAEFTLAYQSQWIKITDDPLSPVGLIAAERERQVSQEGWSAEHDDAHDGNQIAMAAACYASPVPLKAKILVNCGGRVTMRRRIKRVWEDSPNEQPERAGCAASPQQV